jgi:AraC-like DNA-binding protein
MQVRRYVPGLALDDAVEAYTLLDMDQGTAAQPLRMLPPLSISLCLHYGGRVIAGYRNEVVVATGSAVTGMHTGPRTYSTPDRIGIVLVTFRAGAVGQFFRVAADELLHLNVELSDLLPPGERDRIEEELARARDDRARVEAVERFLERLRTGQEADRLARRAAALITQRGGDISIAALAAAHHVSERQLERRFTRAIGITPKKFARLARFHRVVQHIASADSIADLAAACGYYDQSHLIKDARQFSGGIAELMPDSGVTNLIFEGRE